MQLALVALVYEFYPRVVYQIFGFFGATIAAAIWFADISRPLLAVAAFSALYPTNIKWRRATLPCLLIGVLCAAIPLLFGQWQSQVANADTDVCVLVLLAALTALHASFMEEVFFRGFLLNWVLNVSPPLLAMIPQALLFGMFHLRPDTRHFGTMLWFIGFALSMSLIRIRTVSIWPCIALHFGYDFSSCTLFGATRNGLAAHGIFGYPAEYNELLAATTFVALVCLIVAFKIGISRGMQS